MILSNVEIFRALDEKRLVIQPEPSPRRPSVGQSHSPYDTHSVDLTLGDEIVVPKKGQFIYDLTQPGSIAETIRQHSETVTLNHLQPFFLEPNRFILGRTRERVELPISAGYSTCLAARIEGKSSRARFGILVHFTAPTVHPGFKGTLTLEIINLGPASFVLRPGMPIAQLIVEEVKGCPVENPSQFQGQNSPAG
ncbi:MAG: dCTP deaminase [Planctomycetota bacterium]|nr:dCTP deaminase [Planctomycetota bacterium]